MSEEHQNIVPVKDFAKLPKIDNLNKYVQQSFSKYSSDTFVELPYHEFEKHYYVKNNHKYEYLTIKDDVILIYNSLSLLYQPLLTLLKSKSIFSVNSYGLIGIWQHSRKQLILFKFADKYRNMSFNIVNSREFIRLYFVENAAIHIHIKPPNPTDFNPINYKSTYHPLTFYSKSKSEMNDADSGVITDLGGESRLTEIEADLKSILNDSEIPDESSQKLKTKPISVNSSGSPASTFKSERPRSLVTPKSKRKSTKAKSKKVIPISSITAEHNQITRELGLLSYEIGACDSESRLIIGTEGSHSLGPSDLKMSNSSQASPSTIQQTPPPKRTHRKAKKSQDF